MSCQQNSLTSWNTFHLEAQAANITIVRDADALCKCWQESRKQQLPILILGEGSNVLFLEDFSGQVLINRIRGIEIKETGHSWHLHVGAGENWHQLVKFCLQKGIAGLENLALIPGCAGSAPIQNIGAYGVEFQQLCEYVSIVHLPTGKQIELSADECAFGYRDSVFKHRYHDEYAIVAIGLRLDKLWQPVLTYGDLVKLNPETVTPAQVFDAVCHMRRSKLPDPAVKGNAGSFFKNPVIDDKKAKTLLQVYPHMPCYPQAEDKVKLAAGWLIDRCELKGFSVGGAMVHRQQALVLINEDNASGQDIVALARTVRQRVGEKFDIWLEPEVRFIGAQGEMDAVREIS